MDDLFATSYFSLKYNLTSRSEVLRVELSLSLTLRLFAVVVTDVHQIY